ncbi:YD repeat-containing protein [Luteibacter sp. 22Crub2.1]|nr:YD repeat-containing protein [Luteibacter sp. 22Crub2.1]
MASDLILPSSLLRFDRIYNSGAVSPTQRSLESWKIAPPLGRLGARWRHTYDRSLERTRYYDSEAKQYGLAMQARRSDGSIRVFELRGGQYIAARGDLGALLETAEGWEFTENDGSKETYDKGGRLRSIANRSGEKVSLHYGDELDGSPLALVVDSKGRSISLIYDEAGRISELQAPDGATTRFEYAGDGPNGQLSSVIKPDGSKLTYLYDEPSYVVYANRFLTGVIGPDGRRWATFSYDFNGHATRTTHAGGAGLAVVEAGLSGSSSSTIAGGGTTSYLFADVAGQPRLTQLTTPAVAGRTRASLSVTYNDDGTPATVKDLDGSVTTYAYDPKTHLETARVEGFGSLVARTIRTAWDPGLRLPVRIEAPGMWEEMRYNGDGQLLEYRKGSADDSSSADGERTTRFAYRGDGSILSVDGPREGDDDTYRFEYFEVDAPGRTNDPKNCTWRAGDMKSVTSPLGNVRQVLAYDGAGRALSVLDENDVRIDITYDILGRITSKSRESGGSSNDPKAGVGYSYDVAGNLAEIVDADNVKTKLVYDDARRLTSIELANGSRVVYQLDARGLKTKETVFDANAEIVGDRSRIFDALGRVRTKVDAKAQKTEFTYDAAGRLASWRDPLGRVVTRTYDALGRLSRQVADPSDSASGLSLAYDGLDRLSSFTDPKGLETIYLRNGLGDLLRESSPDSGESTFVHDNTGALLRKGTADGHSMLHRYDIEGRLVGITMDGSVSKTFDYHSPPAYCGVDERHSVGRLATATDGLGHTSYCYNAAGQITRKVQSVRGRDFSIRYAYSPAGRLRAITYPDGSTVSYDRDASGNVVKVSLNDSVRRFPHIDWRALECARKTS